MAPGAASARPTALLVLAVAACAGPGGPRALPPRGTLIAHGLGGIGGVTYSNSREAFELWYGRGRRWFEADVAFTADRHLVCLHSGLEPWLGLRGSASTVTLERFLAWRVAGAYTPLSLGALLELLRARPDAFLILDTGGMNAELVEALEQTIDTVEPQLRCRILAEFGTPDELVLLRRSEGRHGRFGALGYATYQRMPREQDVVRLVTAESVPVVLVGAYATSRGYVSRLHAAGARVIVSTVNDPERAKRYFEDGADALMSDFLAVDAVSN